MVIEGGCFCGAIRYRIEGALQHARACHCSRCRKAFSGASSAYAEVAPGSKFVWTAGEDQLTRYSSGHGWGMAFCSACGSTLCGMFGDRVHGVTLGCVDGDPGVRIEMHIFVGSKAPWDHIGGGAPQFEEQPRSQAAPSAERRARAGEPGRPRAAMRRRDAPAGRGAYRRRGLGNGSGGGGGSGWFGAAAGLIVLKL